MINSNDESIRPCLGADAERRLDDPDDLVEQDGVGVSVGAEGEQHRHRRLPELAEGLGRPGGAAVAQGRAGPRPPGDRVPAALPVHRVEGDVHLGWYSVMS